MRSLNIDGTTNELEQKLWTNYKAPLDNIFIDILEDRSTIQYHTTPQRGSNGKLSEFTQSGTFKGKRRHLIKDIVAILIGVYNYLPGTGDANHTIAAVKHNNILYCFNPHGNLSQRIDEQIFNMIARDYYCGRIIMYTGRELQQGLPSCVGFAVNFVYNFLAVLKANGTFSGKFNRWVESSLIETSQSVYQNLLKTTGYKPTPGGCGNINELYTTRKRKNPVRSRLTDIQLLNEWYNNLQEHNRNREIHAKVNANSFSLKRQNINNNVYDYYKATKTKISRNLSRETFEILLANKMTLKYK